MHDFLQAHAAEAQHRFGAFLRGKPIYPLQLELHLTDLCNHGCLWCVSERHRALARSLEWDRLADCLTQAAEHGLKEVFITGGGEPLLHPHIVDLLELCRRLGLGVLLYTNGSRPRPAILAKVAQSAFAVRVSLDAGDAETYSRVRRVPAAAYAEAVSFVQHLLQLRGESRQPRVVLSFVGVPQNIASVPNYVRLALALGVDLALLKTNILADDRSRHLHLSQMVALARATLGVWPHPRVSAYDAPQDIFVSRAGQLWAAAPLKAVIHSNWDVSPCCHSGGQGKYKIGNMSSGGFLGVLGSKKHQNLMWDLVFGAGEKCMKCLESSMNQRATALLAEAQSYQQKPGRSGEHG